MRARKSTATFTGHTQEVCGLRWSFSGQQLASGGNDNLLHIWDAAVSASSAEQSAPLFRLEGHQAAVKALAWCPYQNNVLASGGGTADRRIKFWNTKVGYCTNSIDTNSQVEQRKSWLTERTELAPSSVVKCFHSYVEKRYVLLSLVKAIDSNYAGALIL